MSEGEKIVLAGMTADELKEYMEAHGERPYRAGQVFAWLHKGASFDEMSDVPQKTREWLKAEAVETGVTVIKRLVSALDGTTKYLFLLRDGNIIEGVTLSYKYGNTFCVSSQVGCRMGCAFCASTVDGLVRNLNAGEMAGMVILASREAREAAGGSGRGITNIVMMGSGEPLENYDNVLQFIRIIIEQKGLGIGRRNISLSTCGIVPKIYKLADEKIGITLSISLHAPNDELRRQIMPVARAYPLNELIDAVRYYIEKTGRRVIFEYALIAGVNDSLESARELARLVRRMQCHINLIPVNEVRERGFKPPEPEAVRAFQAELRNANISVTVRREMGADIEGACGQLRRRYLESRS